MVMGNHLMTGTFAMQQPYAAISFMHNFSDQWVKCNAGGGIDITIKDVPQVSIKSLCNGGEHGSLRIWKQQIFTLVSTIALHRCAEIVGVEGFLLDDFLPIMHAVRSHPH